MNKFTPLALSLLLAFIQAAACFAQGGVAKTAKAVQSLSKGVVSASVRNSISSVTKATITRMMLPAGLVPSRLNAVKAPNASLPTKVSNAVAQARPNNLLDITSLKIAEADATEIFKNLKQAPAFQQPKLFLSVFPYLNISREFAAPREEALVALNTYRNILTTSLKINNSAKTANIWGRNMAAVSNLGFYGTQTDGELILDVALAEPEAFAAYTDVIVSRALLAVQAYEPLQKLAAKRAANGQLPSHWDGVVQYARQENLPVEFAPVSAGSSVLPMPKDVKTSLADWNPLNLFHEKISAEDTRAWLAQRELAQTNIAASKTQPAAAPNKPAQAGAPKTGAAQPQTTPEAVNAPQVPAYNSNAPPETDVAQYVQNLRSEFITYTKGTKGPLAEFCQSQDIAYEGQTLAEVVTLISANPRLRSEFISAVTFNSNEIVNKLIKGFNKQEDAFRLQQVYPPQDPTQQYSPQLGEDLLNLLTAVTDPATIGKRTRLLNNGYVYIVQPNNQKVALGSEFHTHNIPELSEYIKDFNRTHGIGREDFLRTFDPELSKTAATRNDGAKVDPHRVFIFEGFKKGKRFNELPDFLRENPNAVLQSILYQWEQEGEFYNPKTNETIKKHNIYSRQEEEPPELKTLKDLLQGGDTRAVLLLQGENAEENFRFMYHHLNALKPKVLDILRTKIGDEEMSVSYRFGRHEIGVNPDTQKIENSTNIIPISNMHMHLEVYIPSQDFTYNLSIPLRASQTAKENIYELFTEWKAAGQPNGSPIEHYAKPGFTVPAAQEPEMYEGNISLNLAY